MASSTVRTYSWIYLQQTETPDNFYCDINTLAQESDSQNGFKKTSPVKWDNTHLFIKSIYELVLTNLPKNLSLNLNLSLASEKQQKNNLKNYMLKPYYMDSSPLSYLTLFLT